VAKRDRPQRAGAKSADRRNSSRESNGRRVELLRLRLAKAAVRWVVLPWFLVVSKRTLGALASPGRHYLNKAIKAGGETPALRL